MPQQNLANITKALQHEAKEMVSAKGDFCGWPLHDALGQATASLLFSFSESLQGKERDEFIAGAHSILTQWFEHYPLK